MRIFDGACVASLLLVYLAPPLSCASAALVKVEDLDDAPFWVLDELRVGGALRADSALIRLVGNKPRLNPLVLTPPVPGCDVAASHCFLQVSESGVLGVYAGAEPSADQRKAKLLRRIGGPQTANGETSAAVSESAMASLVLQHDGNLVLSAVGRDHVRRVLWASNSSLPSECLPESPCATGAYVALLPDGSLGLFLGLSESAAVYLEVGLPAVSKLEQCIWHNDFTGGGHDSPRRALEASSAQDGCQAPPILSLASFPSSGATFTLAALVASTNHTVYTCSKAGCIGTVHQHRDICGQDAWNDKGMCPLGYASAGTPLPGKGAVVKNHVIGDGDTALCSVDLFKRGLLMSENGIAIEPYGFARLFRDPFDNIVGRMHHRVDDGHLTTEPYSKKGFLADRALFPQHDIWTYLYWHLNANLAFKDINKPTALFTLENIDKNQVAYVRSILELLGYSEEDVNDATLKRLFSGPASAEAEAIQNRFRHGSRDIPVHIDFYDADTIHYIAKAIDTVLEGSQCMSRPYCMAPGGAGGEGFRDITVLNPQVGQTSLRMAEGGAR